MDGWVAGHKRHFCSNIDLPPSSSATRLIALLKCARGKPCLPRAGAKLHVLGRGLRLKGGGGPCIRERGFDTAWHHRYYPLRQWTAVTGRKSGGEGVQHQHNVSPLSITPPPPPKSSPPPLLGLGPTGQPPSIDGRPLRPLAGDASVQTRQEVAISRGGRKAPLTYASVDVRWAAQEQHQSIAAPRPTPPSCLRRGNRPRGTGTNTQALRWTRVLPTPRTGGEAARESLEGGGGGGSPKHYGPDSTPKAFPYPNTGPNRSSARQ